MILLKEVLLNLETLIRDSLPAQRFQTLTTSLFEIIWVSSLIGELSKGRGSLRHEMTKLGPQRIMLKSSKVSWPPLLAVLSIKGVVVKIYRLHWA